MNPEPAVCHIKKYPNRRFYDATHSRHVTQDEMYELVRGGTSIQVTDSSTGQDITNQVLAQMILERDPPKLGLFPAGLLHQVIQANQNILHSFVERYFSRALDAFLQSQQQFEEFLRRAGVPDPALANPLHWARTFFPAGLGGVTGGGSSAAATRGEAGVTEAPAPAPAETPSADSPAIAELRAQLADVSAQLQRLRAASNGRDTDASPKRRRHGGNHHGGRRKRR